MNEKQQETDLHEINKAEEQGQSSANIEAPKKKSKTRRILSTVFLVVIYAAGIYVMLQLAESFGAGDKKTLGEIIANLDYKFLLFAFLLFLAMLTLDVAKYSLVSKVTIGKAHVRNSAKVAFIGKYYDNITPFAVGGQPFQIYYLSKRGYTGGQSSAIILIKYFAQMFSWTIVALVLMASNAAVLNAIDISIAVTIKISAWVGFAVNAMPTVIVILFAIMPSLTDKIVYGVIWFGNKLHIVKDRQKTMDKAKKLVSDFKMCFGIMSKKPLALILLVLICFAEPLVTLSIPYFLVVSMAHEAPLWSLWFTVITLNMYAMYSVAVFPTPGNSGFFETTFSLLFSSVAAGVLFYVTLSWRFFTYYFYIIVGLCITLFTMIRDAVKRRKDKLQKGEKYVND